MEDGDWYRELFSSEEGKSLPQVSVPLCGLRCRGLWSHCKGGPPPIISPLGTPSRLQFKREIFCRVSVGFVYFSNTLLRSRIPTPSQVEPVVPSNNNNQLAGWWWWRVRKISPPPTCRRAATRIESFRKL
ncbi:hypothetical protein CDAR_423991 [Caerostris darwini]|uniref:Uncharacterized protein n=1 Tax=Caerostris darwini TaxID=1538125 RepID=A0AAV4VN00_9ARAC|nr:hypothetical protein CDAR_423991 [Caerostris darwini]